jgi:STE24 endopeptidase
MNEFSWLFVGFLLAGLLLELYLNRRQQRHVEQHSDAVPEDFKDRISLEDHQKAARYTIEKLRLGNLSLLYSGALLLAWTLGGGIQWLFESFAGMELDVLYRDVAFLLGVMILMSLLELPFSLWNTFVLEQKYGFNRQNGVQFARDQLINIVLVLLLGGPLIGVILWLMQISGDLWWLYGWAVWISFILLMTWAYPTFIAPLFNKFEPLHDGELRSRLSSLLQRCDFRDNGMFVMDGSRRSSHGNAYFTGFGRNKRIVFFDTLLTQLNPIETEAVLAHELGHFKHRHILKRLLSMSIITLLGFALLGWLRHQDWFFSGLGVNQSGDALALLLFVLAVPVFSLFLSPVGAWFSRKHEFEADSFAVEQSSGSDLVAALVKLYRDNANTLTPDPVYSAFHHSHPPASVRIAHIYSRMHSPTPEGQG